VSFDRDENAARNMLAKGCGGLGMPAETPIPVRFEPDFPPGEAIGTEPMQDEVIRKVDVGKITNLVTTRNGIIRTVVTNSL
jgi:hypothetical protein